MSRIAMRQFVSEIERATIPLPEISPKAAFRSIAGFDTESCSQYHGSVIGAKFHPFFAAIHFAFCDHRPLVLSPDIFWLLILQGLARHLEVNAETLRPHFVDHEGKRELTVRRDDFVKGSPENPWAEVVESFSGKIRNMIGPKNHRRIMAEFSTTGPLEKTVFEITLMDAMSSYASYYVPSLCGIPEVKLEGTAEDWAILPKRVARIGKAYDMSWWTKTVVRILKRIARNAAGTDDPQLWKNIYKVKQYSGGPYCNGWIVEFLPYLEKPEKFHKVTGKPPEDWQDLMNNPSDYRWKPVLQRNELLGKRRSKFDGLKMLYLPGYLSHVPFIWEIGGKRHEMELAGGFFAVEQWRENLALKPKIGWAVRDLQANQA